MDKLLYTRIGDTVYTNVKGVPNFYLGMSNEKNLNTVLHYASKEYHEEIIKHFLYIGMNRDNI